MPAVSSVVRTGMAAFTALKVVASGKMKITGNETSEDLKEKLKFNQQWEDATSTLIGKTAAMAVGVTAIGYNYGIKIARMGQRGQDRRDQNAIQDKMINTGLGILGAAAGGFITGGAIGAIGAAALALVTTTVSEIMSTTMQIKQYNYDRAVDYDATAVTRERMGDAAYNYSRRRG